jgi:electron transport complex protein RnfG
MPTRIDIYGLLRRICLREPAAQLGLFGLIGIGVVSLIYYAGKERILANQQLTLFNSVISLIPAREFDNDVLSDTLRIIDPRLSGGAPFTVLRARHQGQPVAAIFATIAPDGYSGDIRILVAVRANGELAGVRVLDHHETPGLGDRIEADKSNWIEGFAGQSLNSPSESSWLVRRDGGDFDQFTGATITPRAVVTQVRETLRVFRDRRNELLETDAPSGAPKLKPGS